MSGPIYPDVPDVPGVPPVNRLTNAQSAAVNELNGDAITVTATAHNQWGIYTADGAKALEADSIMAVGFDAETRIADFPIEEGNFESYDKVALPFSARVVMTKGGTIGDRRDFLAKLEEIRADLKLYNVVTPERTYLNANIARVSFDRNREQGSNLLTVEVVLQEIRQNVTASFTASQPSAASPTNNGAVQAAPTDAATKQIAETKSAVATPPGGTPFYSGLSGQQLLSIATSADVPAQKLAVQLAGKSVGITLAQKSTGLFADITMAGQAVASGILCRDGARLINAAYAGFPGDLMFADTQGSSDPDYTGLGTRFLLLWAS